MADYIVKDTELTSVANAIRTAGGTSSLLNFPNGFVSAVNNISGGGGSSDFSTAQVTFINADPTTTPYSVEIFHITDDAYISAERIMVSDSVTVTVPLYKGRAQAEILMLQGASESYMPTATGGVSFELPKFVITGDGTITAKGLQQM